MVGYKSCNLAMSERQVQLGYNKVTKLADEYGFTVYLQKSTCVLFSRKGGLHPDPHNHLHCQRLTFIAHNKYLKNKSQKAINVINVLSRTSWGSDIKCLMNLHKGLICIRLDYGANIYQSAAKLPFKCLALSTVWASAFYGYF